MTINWIVKKFEDLKPLELYAIMRLRIEVFVVEQIVPFRMQTIKINIAII